MAKILLLEDDAVLAGQLKTMLTRGGHDTALFEDATSAIQHIEQEQVDIVIADLFITKNGKFVPDGGIMLNSNIRQLRGASIPVIAISGSFSEMHGTHATTTAKTVGATAILAKPFHPDALLQMVSTQLETHQAAS
ncbi:MAG: response regulator [Litoreibacter sp.]|nr:response regulator [Litoreibacter sp.]